MLKSHTSQTSGLPVLLISDFFKVTLYHKTSKKMVVKDWHEPIIGYLKKHKKISPKKAQALWNVTPRTTSTRLKNMYNRGILLNCQQDHLIHKKHSAYRSLPDKN